MRKDITIAAETRNSRGKNEARRLRVKGSMPAIVYGAQGHPEPVAVSPKEIGKILNSKTGHNTIFNLSLAGGDSTPVMIIDWQYDPIKDNLLHVDLKRIDLTKRIHVKVPIATHGDPKGVKLQGGLLELITREIEIDCLPDEIPEQFDMDVSELRSDKAFALRRSTPRVGETAEYARRGDRTRRLVEGRRTGRGRRGCCC